MSNVKRLLGAGLLLGVLGCADSDSGEDESGGPAAPASGTLAGLARAEDCTDLLTKVQDDAIAKLRLTVERAKLQYAMGQGVNGGGSNGGVKRDAGVARPVTGNTSGGSGPSPESGGAEEPPTLGLPQDPSFADDDGESSNDVGGGPTSASETNVQVADVDEADFIKVVESGKGIFLLHGNTLRKLKTWPAAESALVGESITIEGTPSEMFVTDDGKAVVFSDVYGYQAQAGSGGDATPGKPSGDDIYCDPSYCKGYGSALKITVLDVTTALPTVQRELYFEGSYLSSRRHAAGSSDVVRAIVQAPSKFSGLFSPQVELYDAWGTPFEQADIDTQLDEWAERNIAAIRRTKLEQWLPVAHEVQDKKLVAVSPQCGDYFVPTAGLSDYGLTQVVTLDVKQPAQPARTLTIVGAASTVYANADKLVLAQPDYRWSEQNDFGVANEQQTALHVFGLTTTDTNYLASGWVPGVLPQRNPQFGIDVAADGTIRLATTGLVRDQPTAARTTPAFWNAQHTDNRVLTARVDGKQVSVLAKTVALGHQGESVYAARFVGDRAYVVTFRQTDPLIVVDVANANVLPVLGEIEIPGFSEYMHPLDATHLITLGQAGGGGIQLQLFDVSNPSVSIPPPKVLSFGQSTNSAVSYQHKALTVFEGVLAIPLSGYGYDKTNGYQTYKSTLQLVRVDANTGFSELASIDHAPLYADNGAGVGCGRCDPAGCYEYACGYEPEVRRGAFVKGAEGTYVYSFSHAGVLVNNLASPATPVARIGLPQPTFGYSQPWYGTDGNPLPVQPPITNGGSRDAGVAPIRVLDAGSVVSVGPLPVDAGVPVADASVDLPVP